MADAFRDMCAELLADYDNCHYRSELSDRAHSLLDQPEPEGPTDEELLRLYGVATPSYHVHEYRRELAFARAVLAKWGRPTPQPEPSELTDEEWDELVARAWDKYETVGYRNERFMYDSDFGNALDFVRKELTRWGRPTPQSEEAQP